ncbi:hypothetical protein AL755_13590 [Arthrobacter sp. ERGS1:01]|uniref:hypothetical protein n=1 Tax=Arthrobacter sp. ERGS1:01 TaxID=1704044 RepID=UPI0006B66D40|nr:hypothetical protein [Arthrobacter sp. ERGS1:01]ALE06250.1 hypothetical protein AL755_13590 [Arthrobacter sp. ERGS1:01]
MSGLDDLLAESNDRWSRAMRNAQDVKDLGLGQAVRTYYIRYFPAGVLVLIVAGTALGLLLFRGNPSAWPQYLALGLVLAAAGTVIGGLIYNAKKVSPAARLPSGDILFPLESEERKQINRQIAGKAPIDREHLSVARAGAVQQRKGLARLFLLMPSNLFLFASLTANWAGQAAPLAWLMLAAVAATITGMVFLIRDFRRAGRFLTTTPAF